MPLIIKLRNALRNDVLIGLGLLLIFLATNGYTYAWDDQHLEIPLLKSLIDPQLYPGDYYVEALKSNFTSFLFPILAKIITIDQVPTAYFILYILSRFALFFYAYKTWKIIAKNKLNAALCVLSFILVFRVEEFLYRTFSHQEFALGIIMAGIYYFYKNRFGRAAVLLGIAANFHALYSLFPFCYMALYLLWKAREDQGKILFKSIGLFILCSTPLIIWTFWRLFTHIHHEPDFYHNWINLYLLACPATFLFDTMPIQEMVKNFPAFFKGTQQFWPVIVLFGINFIFNPNFRKDQKAQAFIVGGSIFILISFVFSYIFPSRFTLDLNLVRNLQFMSFILIGYTTILLAQKVDTGRWEIAGLAVILFSLLRYNHFHLSYSAKISLGIIIAGVVLSYLAFRFFKNPLFKTLVLLIPFLVSTVHSMYYHKVRLDIERTAGGFWQLQRNWIDMQKYVRAHTPKNALILTPNDMEMGGFRIFSERRVLVCYRDCGVIGFDYGAALEWQRRLSDIEHFKVMVDGDIRPALVNAISKYKVNYIVFMRYLNPGNNTFLQPVYENETFALYRVSTNPI
jgi:hypothetical protein